MLLIFGIAGCSKDGGESRQNLEEYQPYNYITPLDGLESHETDRGNQYTDQAFEGNTPLFSEKESSPKEQDPVPEPSTLVILGSGIMMTILCKKKKGKQQE